MQTRPPKCGRGAPVEAVPRRAEVGLGRLMARAASITIAVGVALATTVAKPIIAAAIAPPRAYGQVTPRGAGAGKVVALPVAVAGTIIAPSTATATPVTA